MRTFTIVPSFEGNSAFFELPDIGFQGDNLSFAILFNLTELTEHWPDILPAMIITDSKNNTFLATHTRWDSDKHIFTWIISETETMYEGVLKCQLKCMASDDPETVVCMSQICQTRVYKSLEAQSDPPEAFQSWLDTLALLGAEVHADAEVVIDAIDTVEDYKTDAETAASNASASETAAAASALNASVSASDANASKLAAQTAVTNANASKTAAETAASNASSSATSAAASAANASASETAAATSAENASASETAAETAATAAQSSAATADTLVSKITNMTVAATGLSEGSNPTATVSEVSGHKHIDFGIPKGDTGIGVDSVVLNQDYTLTITLTNGQTITTGSVRGAKGDTGQNAYVHIRYAAQQPTSNSDMKTTVDEWIGIYNGTSETAPASYTSYTWYRFKGETGIADNIYGNVIPMSSTDSTKVSAAINAKYTKPASGIPASDIASGVIPGVMTGSTAQAAGTAGLVPAPAAGSQNKALFGDGTWKAVADPSDMTGASQSAAGTHGLVPAPSAGDQDKALFGDGTWKTVSVEDPDDFTGATASAAGTHGLVPAPAAGDQTKVLTGDGTWKVSPGAKVYEKTVTVTNTSGAYSQTFTDENISADMKAVELEVNRSYVFGDSIIVTPNDGSVTVACSDMAGTDTIKISLIKVIDDPTAVTSTEFTILNNRLLAVENVCVDTDISIATTDWTLTNGVYSYTWTSAAITALCGVEVFLRDGAENAGICDFDYAKVTGGVQFTTSETPAGNLPLTIHIINCKSTDIDDFRGTIDLSFTIPSDGWSSTSPYTYTWTNQYVTSNCGVEVEFFSGTENTEVSYLEYEKVSNGVLFTSAVKPTTGIPVCVHIVNTLTYNYTTLTADMVSTDAVSGAVNADEAFTELDGKCTANTQAIANKVPDNNTDIQSVGKIYKAGNIVTLLLSGWVTVSNITIPSEYRPALTAMLAGIVLQNGSAAIGRVSVNTNGSITCPDGQTQIWGCLTWLC